MSLDCEDELEFTNENRAVWTVRHIGLATLILADSRSFEPDWTFTPYSIITDPIWPNAPEGMFAQDCDADKLLRDVLMRHLEATRCTIIIRADSDPRFLRAVPSKWEFFRVCSLTYAVPGYIGRKLGGMEVAYAFGPPIPAGPGQMVIPGSSQPAQGDTVAKSVHPCPRNIHHMKFLVRWFSEQGEIVFDPFMGSGTIGVAAVEMGRRFVGIEVNPSYFEFACERLENIQRQGRLFE